MGRFGTRCGAAVVGSLLLVSACGTQPEQTTTTASGEAASAAAPWCPDSAWEWARLAEDAEVRQVFRTTVGDAIEWQRQAPEDNPAIQPEAQDWLLERSPDEEVLVCLFEGSAFAAPNTSDVPYRFMIVLATKDAAQPYLNTDRQPTRDAVAPAGAEEVSSRPDGW